MLFGIEKPASPRTTLRDPTHQLKIVFLRIVSDKTWRQLCMVYNNARRAQLPRTRIGIVHSVHRGFYTLVLFIDGSSCSLSEPAGLQVLLLLYNTSHTMYGIHCVKMYTRAVNHCIQFPTKRHEVTVFSSEKYFPWGKCRCTVPNNNV